MAVEIVGLLFALIFNIVYCGEPSTNLVDLTAQTLTVFYDFDRTLLVESFGGKIQQRCIDLNLTNTSCSGEGEMVAALNSYPDPDERCSIAFGNQTRLDQVKAHLDRLLEDGNSLNGGYFYVLSTSWEPIPASEWEKMISAVLAKVGLSSYFPDSQILGLDDPGPGIQADKGSKLAAALTDADLDISMNECIFADDKLGNLNWANCDTTDADGNPCTDYGGDRYICDTLLIQEREGMDGTDMQYIEARGVLPASETIVTVPPVTVTVPGETVTVACGNNTVTVPCECPDTGGVMFDEHGVMITMAFVFVSTVVYMSLC